MGLTQELPMFVSLQGRTVLTTLGTPLPLLGVTYATGTITTTVGNNIIEGSGTTWNVSNLPDIINDYIFKTLAGEKFRIKRIIDATHIEIVGIPAAAESAVAYQIYRRPHCAAIIIGANSANTGTILRFGIDGQVDHNSSPTKGLMLVSEASRPYTLPIDLYDTDIWADSDNSGDIIEWMLLK